MSRFVSAGADEQPTERDEAWLTAQQQIEATKQQKTSTGQQQDGKSLYETLQANKAAKQDAFEEATRLRNQFRSLDEDEVDFLDSVLESSRSKEAEVKKETFEQLEAFRRQREEAEKAAKEEEDVGTAAPPETWSVGPRKRKKGKESAGIGGVKLRKKSTAEEGLATAGTTPSAAARVGEPMRPDGEAAEDEVPQKRFGVHEQSAALTVATTAPVSMAKPAATPKTALGLAAYSSDEDD